MLFRSTAGTGSVIDTAGDNKDVNANGVPDRVETGIQSMYPGTTTADIGKREALLADAKYYTSILNITNDNLPTTKAQAIAIIYPDSFWVKICKVINSDTFSYSEIESVNDRILLMNVYSKEKMKRYQEISKLSGYLGLGNRCN